MTVGLSGLVAVVWERHRRHCRDALKALRRRALEGANTLAMVRGIGGQMCNCMILELQDWAEARVIRQ